MSKLQYTVTVRFMADASDTATIDAYLSNLAAIGEIVETKAKAVAEKKQPRRQVEAT